MKLVNPLGRVAEADAKVSGIISYGYGVCNAACSSGPENRQMNLDVAKAQA